MALRDYSPEAVKNCQACDDRWAAVFPASRYTLFVARNPSVLGLFRTSNGYHPFARGKNRAKDERKAGERTRTVDLRFTKPLPDSVSGGIASSYDKAS